jgi:glucosamine--fructose-6-phosphate aminotransferase (isomerizing)
LSRGIVPDPTTARQLLVRAIAPSEAVKFANEIASALETELRDQGPALVRREASGWRDAERAARLLARDDVDYLLIAARGSSDNAARYGQYLLGLETGLTAALAAPWLYGHGHQPPGLSRAAVLAISQSGRSPDVVGVLAAARAQRRPTIALTNSIGAPLAEQADVVVDLAVGPERSVAATKTYTASLHALAQIASAMVPDRISRESVRELPAQLEAAVADQLRGRQRYDVLARARPLTVVGRGLDYATAHETALKVRELSGVPSEGFSLPDLLHGPVAALDRDAALWMTSSGSHAEAEVVEAFAELRSRAGVTVAVSGDPRLLELVDLPVRIPGDLAGWAGPVIAVVPGQVAGLRLAEIGQRDIDRPFGLAKVTLTR